MFITSRQSHIHTAPHFPYIWSWNVFRHTRCTLTVERCNDCPIACIYCPYMCCCQSIDDKPLVRSNRPYGKLILTGFGNQQAVNSCLPRLWHNLPSFSRYANEFPTLKFTINMATHYEYTTSIEVFPFMPYLVSGTKWTGEYTNSVNRELELVTK